LDGYMKLMALARKNPRRRELDLTEAGLVNRSISSTRTPLDFEMILTSWSNAQAVTERIH
jgi:hypothetical protein